MPTMAVGPSRCAFEDAMMAYWYLRDTEHQRGDF